MTRIDLSTMELTEATPWTPEEELAEAKAWGFDTVEAWQKHMDLCMDEGCPNQGVPHVCITRGTKP